MEWKIESNDKSIVIFLESTTNTMTGLRINKLPESGVIDLNEMPDSEDIRIIDCGYTHLPFTGPKKIKKMILPKNATDVKRMCLMRYDDNESLPFGEVGWKGLKLEELVWPDNAAVIHKSFGETCSFSKISNIGNVETLENSAFDNSDIEEFTMPPKVREIPDNCFFDSLLQKIDNLDNIETVGKEAFGGCTHLRYFQWPKKCREIPPMCFSHCANLLEIENIGHVTNIGEGAFQKSGIEIFQWPEKCTKISEMCFMGSTIEQINGMENVEIIEKGAFMDCTYIYEFNWPEKCTEIPEQCFSGSCCLDKISGIERVTKINNLAFYGCGFKKFDWPRGCKAIPSQCFDVCINLSEISGIENVEKIGAEAFGSSGIRNFKWPAACTVVGVKCFFNSRLETIENLTNVETIGPMAFSMTKLKSISWPKKCRKISKGCFSGCKNLRSISGINVINSIAENAFRESGITEINLENSMCISIGELAFANSKIERFVPGYYTTFIAEDAFNCTALS